jgi:chorismate-pyruvate lyase
VDDVRRVLRRALAERPTVTGFLESLTGERLVADVLSQGPTASDPDDGLGVAPDRTVVRRIARLRGRGGTPYVYADTAFVPGALPAGARRRLAQESDPIGRVLVEEGLAPLQLPPLGPVPWRRPEPFETEVAKAVVWRRAYRLALAERPVFAIREWFLRPVLEALATSGRECAERSPSSAPTSHR